MNDGAPGPELDFGAALHRAGERLAAVVEAGRLDAAVASCPPWTLRELAGHVGFIHRWATAAIIACRAPDDTAIAEPPCGDGAALARWLRDGLEGVRDALHGLDPDAPTWHPFPLPAGGDGRRRAGLWLRRLAHETTLHRWDGEAALGEVRPIDPALAADAVAEYFEVIVPRLIERDAVTIPRGVLRIGLTDVGRYHTVEPKDPGTLRFSTEDEPTSEPGVVGLRGEAEAVLLALWARRPPAAVPDDSVARRWLALGGN